MDDRILEENYQNCDDFFERPYCMGCNQYVDSCKNGVHVTPAPLWTEEDTPYVCGPVYRDKETALMHTLKDRLDAVISLMGSDEEWAEDALWIELIEPGGLVEAVRMWVEYYD